MASAIGKLPKNGIRTHLKYYFRFVSETIAFETTKFPSSMQNLVKIGKEYCERNRSTTDLWTDRQTHTHTSRQKPK